MSEEVLTPRSSIENSSDAVMEISPGQKVEIVAYNFT
jgi:hypothetical protein